MPASSCGISNSARLSIFLTLQRNSSRRPVSSATAPATLECRMSQIVTLAGRDNYLVIGEVTGIHLRDDCLVNGRFDVTRFQPLARGGYKDYSVVTEVFEMTRPGQE